MVINITTVIEKAVSPYGIFIVGPLDCCRALQSVLYCTSRTAARLARQGAKQLDVDNRVVPSL